MDGLNGDSALCLLLDSNIFQIRFLSKEGPNPVQKLDKGFSIIVVGGREGEEVIIVLWIHFVLFLGLNEESISPVYP